MDQLFIGYDKDFYDAIPYVKVEPDPNEDPCQQRWAIEPSFVEIASKLLFQKNNAKVYEEYGLPDDDEIRRFILDHPQLLFYAPELKKIWDLLGKVSPFMKLLQNQYLLTATMKTLHFSEPAHIALKQFCEAVGADAFANVLISEEVEGYLLLNTAEYYWSKNEDAKEHAFELLKNKPVADALYEILSGPRYSSPVYGLRRHGDDRVIGEYSFERIGSERTSDELAEWFSVSLKEFFFNLYFETMKHFAVYNKQKTPVALLKIEDGTLNEIITDRDVSLTENGLLAAILNWLLDTGFTMGEDTLKDEGE